MVAAPSPANVKVLIYNATPQDGLAADVKTALTQAGSYQANNVAVGTYKPNQAKATSVVMYEHAEKAAAQKVAQALGIKGSVKSVDATTQNLINSGPNNDPGVVVIAGADRTS